MPCPKGIPDSECPGKGNREVCYYYDGTTQKCFTIEEVADERKL